MTATDKDSPSLDELVRRLELSGEEVFRRLLETAPDAVVIATPDGRILYANEQAQAMFGYARNELVGEAVEALIPERLHARHVEHREAYTRGPRQRPMGLDMNLVARRKNGSEFPVEVSLSPVALDGFTVFSAAIRDISRLASAREAVARGRYNAYVAQLGQQVIGLPDVDSLGRVLPALVAEALAIDVVILYLLDLDGAHFTCRGAHGVPPELVARLAGPNDPKGPPGHLIARGVQVVVEDYATEQRFTPDATVAALGLTCALGVPILGEQGPVGALAARSRMRRVFSEDDRNFLQAAANIAGATIKYLRAEEQLRHSQRLDAVGQLSGGIAHDFNNLLTVIIGNLQMVGEEIEGNEAVAQPIEAALRAAGSAAELTRKLLAFSRRQPLRPRAIDVNELVGGMLEMIRRTLGERITILAYPEPRLPAALADPGQLETALLNLVVNARDAMPAGGRLGIETGVRLLEADYARRSGDLAAGAYVMIAVSDNGVGMAPEVLRRAFDPYFTTKDRGKGTGLGLSMVHGFAKQSGGHLTLYSEPGRGTTVRLYLPLSPEASERERPVAAAELPGGGEVVLMVEDEPGVRALGARFLASLGYPVYQAGDAAQALQLLAAHPQIRLLFTDIVLPGPLDGLGLARSARERRPDLRVLFTSGYASGAIDGRQGLDSPLLDKPYRREDLARAVRAVLDTPSP